MGGFALTGKIEFLPYVKVLNANPLLALLQKEKVHFFFFRWTKTFWQGSNQIGCTPAVHSASRPQSSYSWLVYNFSRPCHDERTDGRKDGHTRDKEGDKVIFRYLRDRDVIIPCCSWACPRWRCSHHPSLPSYSVNSRIEKYRLKDVKHIPYFFYLAIVFIDTSQWLFFYCHQIC